MDQTVRRRVDVERAFAETADEPPTKPALVVAMIPAGALERVRPLVPLDAVPVLAVPRTDIPWAELGDLATRLLLRVDGSTCAMRIVTGIEATPHECAGVLADLARGGLVRLVLASLDDGPLIEERVSVA